MAIFSRLQKQSFSKQEKEDGSRFFQYKLPQILAGEQYLLSFSSPDVAYWLPMDFLEINNSSNVNYEIRLNQDKDNVIVSQSGTIKILEDMPIYTLIIKNTSPINSIADTLILNLRKKGIDFQNLTKKISRITGV